MHGDTRPTADVVDAASDASLLIHRATFAEEGSERVRSTAAEAAQVATETGSERRWLTHISPRREGGVEAVRDGATTELARGQPPVVVGDPPSDSRDAPTERPNRRPGRVV